MTTEQRKFIKFLMAKGLPEVYAWMAAEVVDAILLTHVVHLNECLGETLLGMTQWGRTPQGYAFWDAVQSDAIALDAATK